MARGRGSANGDERGAPAPTGAPDAADPLMQNLRSLFKSVEDEPLPERLQELLARLGEEEKK